MLTVLDPPQSCSISAIEIVSNKMHKDLFGAGEDDYKSVKYSWGFQIYTTLNYIEYIGFDIELFMFRAYEIITSHPFCGWVECDVDTRGVVVVEIFPIDFTVELFDSLYMYELRERLFSKWDKYIN